MDRMSRLSVGGCPPPFDPSRDYLAQQELYGLEGRPLGSMGATGPGGGGGGASKGGSAGAPLGEERHHGPQFALLRFDQPVTAPQVDPVHHDLDMEWEGAILTFLSWIRMRLSLGPS